MAEIKSSDTGDNAGEADKEFPVDWSDAHYEARRDFTKFMILMSFTFAAGQFWIGLRSLFRNRNSKPEAREIARVSSLPIGAAFLFDYPEPHDRCVLVRLGEEDFVAYSQKCTHLSCSVIPEPKNGALRCPCHNAAFEMNSGRPLQGPPRRPLDRIGLRIEGDSVYATGLEQSAL